MLGLFLKHIGWYRVFWLPPTLVGPHTKYSFSHSNYNSNQKEMCTLLTILIFKIRKNPEKNSLKMRERPDNFVWNEMCVWSLYSCSCYDAIFKSILKHFWQPINFLFLYMKCFCVYFFFYTCEISHLFIRWACRNILTVLRWIYRITSFNWSTFHNKCEMVNCAFSMKIEFQNDSNRLTYWT